ncbi:putative cytochrome cbb3 oxidase maturation protein CcoH [Formosa agariphila KMM 3901]|uniref:Putative cytochrome cbb3 oxidase maturation protein CcoH n=1 Tax=Formosa agariphila (strain DSM 15362 / KCTC 12365 / LMG 23005 / KMM 3901 / M-2Alg 35-1) TaxID=1347342 RepID=T2KLD1_FORAG|nr:FixH family protein [Formosa agariphila]CDF79707.1 putative cytochrome cbb3 oxidase maturation protein CcoH [Formosa agariphila KMM 3901]
MRINWGTGIVIAFVCFIAFIMYFVVNMMVGDRFNHDLVVEDYYQQELTLQDDIDKEKNSQTLEENVSWKKTAEGILIQFPKSINETQISGIVSLYRPSNKALDFELPIALKNHTLLVPEANLVDGRWNLKVDWTNNGSSYIYKQSLTY